MTVINQIDHRVAYLKQKAAGVIVDNTLKRHTGALPTPILRPKEQKHPLAREDGTKMTIAEQLGLPSPSPSKQKIAPLTDMFPPSDANSPDAPAPEEVADPEQHEVDLAPVADLTPVTVFDSPVITDPVKVEDRELLDVVNEDPTPVALDTEDEAPVLYDAEEETDDSPLV